MKAVARLCALALLAGCASQGGGGRPTTPEVAPGEGAPVGDQGQLATDIDFDGECARAAGLAAAGEHRPAVEALERVVQAGGVCREEVMKALGDSNRRLADADDLARLGLEARRRGDLEAARESFRLALVAYPQYYWVQKLLAQLPEETVREVQDLRRAAADELASGRPEKALGLLERAAALPSAGPEVADEIDRVRRTLAVSRLNAARRAQHAGELSRAVALTRQAITARPEGPVLEEVVDFARRLGLNLFSVGELIEARELWSAALALDQANGLLRQYLDEVEARLRSLDAIKGGGD